MADENGLDGLLAEFGVFDETIVQVRERLGLERTRIRELTGERRLQLAMIELAIKDLIKPTKRTTRADILQAAAWMFSSYESSDYADIATWSGCCRSLGIHPEQLRDGVLALRSAGRRPRLNFAALGDDQRRRFKNRRQRRK